MGKQNMHSDLFNLEIYRHATAYHLNRT